jgi:hypothetical protein
MLHKQTVQMDDWTPEDVSRMDSIGAFCINKMELNARDMDIILSLGVEWKNTDDAIAVGDWVL